MAHMTLFSCDFAGCDCTMDESDARHIAVCLFDEPADEYGNEAAHPHVHVDLCPDHFRVVADRILASVEATI